MIEENYKESYNKEMDSFVEQKRQAVSLANSVGNLLLNHSVELVLFRNDLADTSVSEKIQLIDYSKIKCIHISSITLTEITSIHD